MPNQIPDAHDELWMLLGIAASKLTRSSDPNRFLDWIAKYGPDLTPDLNANLDPRSGPAANFYRLLGVQIYNMTPLAEAGLTIRPLPKPGRNEPCLCGSGRKYKNCCASLEGLPLLDNYNMLRHVLDHYPKNALATLPQSQVDTEAVADTAIQWLDEGINDRALALLEPWFKPDVPLTHRQCPLFNLLMDLYQDLGKPVKRKRLLERACKASNKLLRADALQRKATILMDAGDTAGAWDAFRTAQRLDPDAPALALLEITLLCATGDINQAKARAAFWLARMRRAGGHSPGLIELLELCTRDPHAALFNTTRESSPPPDFINLLDLIQSAPTPKACYKKDTVDNQVMLIPSATLAKLEARWWMLTDTWRETPPWEQTKDWIALLQQEPESWQSVLVVHDLIQAVTSIGEPMLEASLLEPLLQRAEQLLECNLKNIQPPKMLPWLMIENRPALRLLSLLAFIRLDRYEDMAAFTRLAERLIDLNPNDNGGMRISLSSAYLEQNQPDKTIALANQYPDDMLCALPLNHILALYMSGDKGKALAKLAQVGKRHAVAIEMLLAKAPKQPKMSEYGVTLGGKDEAWIYRADTLSLWQQSGALEWLRKARSQR